MSEQTIQSRMSGFFNSKSIGLAAAAITLIILVGPTANASKTHQVVTAMMNRSYPLSQTNRMFFKFNSGSLRVVLDCTTEKGVAGVGADPKKCVDVHPTWSGGPEISVFAMSLESEKQVEGATGLARKSFNGVIQCDAQGKTQNLYTEGNVDSEIVVYKTYALTSCRGFPNAAAIATEMTEHFKVQDKGP